MTADRVQQALAEIGRLREIAQRATASPWRTGRSVGRTLYGHADGPGHLIGLLDRTQDAAHIAAWDPTRALAVLDAAEKVLKRHIAVESTVPAECRYCAAYWPCEDLRESVLDLYAPDGAA